MLRSVTIAVLLWGCCLMATACGYRFTGGGDLPEGVRTINVATLVNRTAETGLENVITNDLIYEFTRSGKAAVTERSKADAVLSGVIRSLGIATVSHKGENVAFERRVTVLVDLKLTDAADNTIWSVRNFSANETYEVESDKLSTEQNKKEAIAQLSKRLAEKAYNRMTEDF